MQGRGRVGLADLHFVGLWYYVTSDIAGKKNKRSWGYVYFFLRFLLVVVVIARTLPSV